MPISNANKIESNGIIAEYSDIITEQDTLVKILGRCYVTLATLKYLDANMIQCRLRELIAEKGRREHRKITYDDVLSLTGISKTTLTRLANDHEEGVAISTINRLCSYFDCQPGDLFVHVEEAQS